VVVYELTKTTLFFRVSLPLMVFVLLVYVAYPLVSVGLSRARTRVYYRWIVARMAPQKHAWRKHLL